MAYASVAADDFYRRSARFSIYAGGAPPSAFGKARFAGKLGDEDAKPRIGDFNLFQSSDFEAASMIASADKAFGFARQPEAFLAELRGSRRGFARWRHDSGAKGMR